MAQVSWDKMTDWNKVNADLIKANRLLGNRIFYNWPSGPRSNWPESIRRARELRESTLGKIVQHVKSGKPYLQKYELIPNDTKYDPEFFKSFEPHSYSKARGVAFGWQGAPSILPKRTSDPQKPQIKLNDSAFANVRTVASSLLHEVWHRIQDKHRNIYYGYNPKTGIEDGRVVRRFDARLKDLEGRNNPFPFQLTPHDRWLAAIQLDNNFLKLRRDPHWNRLINGRQPNLWTTFGERRRAGRVFCNNLLDRYNKVRPAVWTEMTREVLPGSKVWVPSPRQFSPPRNLIRSKAPSTLEVLKRHLYKGEGAGLPQTFSRPRGFVRTPTQTTLQVLKHHLHRWIKRAT